MMNAFCTLFILFFVAVINCELIRLQDGTIEGTVGKTKNGREFLEFHGIPYAEPPIGELRFQAPIPVKPWAGVKPTSSPPPVCTQPVFLSSTNKSPIIGQEDCLYLNVFTPINPNTSQSTKYPVIVYIHGGEFLFGDGADNKPDYFMDRDVILVTINYRLGVLGFFNMNNDHCGGNFGMKDQSLALQWVKDNIASFGGDPNNVTLAGGSAGAVSVHLHMFSPLSQGLFHKAILQSGNAFSTWSYDDDINAEAIATAFIVSVGCFHKDPARVLKCLRLASADELISIGISLSNANPYSTSILFKPSIESKVQNRPFLSQKPSEDTYLTNVPWITGINSADGAFIMQKYFENNRHLFKELKKNKKFILPKIFDYHMIAELKHWDEISQVLLDFYFGNNDVDFATTTNLVQMHTDALFMFPMMKALQTSNSTRYVYLYDHRGSFSWQQFMPDVTVDLGVCHADELPLLFRNEKLEAKWTPQDNQASSTLLNNWINFAIFGDPNGSSQQKLWKPVETNGIEYLHIKSGTAIMAENFMKKRNELWKSLPLTQNL